MPYCQHRWPGRGSRCTGTGLRLFGVSSRRLAFPYPAPIKRKIMNIHCKPNIGATNEWETPPEILTELGPFDDDPCRPDRIDGLTRHWNGLVWLNPPYGPEVGSWLHKLATHGNGIALVFARTETHWFIKQVWRRATSLRFIHGRLHFYSNGVRAKGNAGGPSVLVAY